MEDVRGSRARLMVTSEIKPPLRPEPKRNPNTNTRLKSSYEAMLELLDKKPTTTTTTTTLRKQNSTGSICHQNQNQNQDPGENKDMHQGKDPDHDGVQKDGVKDLPKEKEKEKDSIIIPASQETDYDGGDWDDDDDLLRDIVL
ncbi:hypothetical protein GGR50DRAFT_682106 [Xylaria sp. CBS 124048]|nr:hypothetical protein GGR50DRAFT_682106 [Xylaria sp. CBS 124048]